MLSLSSPSPACFETVGLLFSDPDDCTYVGLFVLAGDLLCRISFKVCTSINRLGLSLRVLDLLWTEELLKRVAVGLVCRRGDPRL